jgi:Spy/CpxP family protein refolding chaperone
MTDRCSFIRKLSIALAAPLLLTTLLTAVAVPASAAVTRWTPKPGVQWQWQLSSTPTADRTSHRLRRGSAGVRH